MPLTSTGGSVAERVLLRVRSSDIAVVTFNDTLSPAVWQVTAAVLGKPGHVPDRPPRVKDAVPCVARHVVTAASVRWKNTR